MPPVFIIRRYFLIGTSVLCHRDLPVTPAQAKAGIARTIERAIAKATQSNATEREQPRLRRE
jgi:hypothetical protein